MLFEITTHCQSTLPVSRQINKTLWLHTIDHDMSYGYQLNAHGGNFLNFKFSQNQLVINFGFFKDYVLSQDLENGVFLSSINCHAKKINSNVVQAVITPDTGIKFVYYNLRDLMLSPGDSLTLPDAIDQIEKILVENLFELQQQTPTEPLKIAYSAGLDSGAVSWLSHKYKINFVSLIDQKLAPKLTFLPFETVISELSAPTRSDRFNPTSWTSFVPPGTYFCNPELNNYVSGYYGDLTMLHIRHMHLQSRHLATVDLDQFEQYDLGSYQNDIYESLPFRNKQDLVNSIIKIHLLPHAQEWFVDFETRDPYRDPRFLKIFLSLNVNDLVRQFKSAIVQKTIISNAGPDCWNFMCKHKNDYSTLGIDHI